MHLSFIKVKFYENIIISKNIPEEQFDWYNKVVSLCQLKALDKSIRNQELIEDGHNISGGQIQRMGVARALYRKPKILLLDESTNGLDYETEKVFLNDLKDLKKEITIIFVSHREHIKDYADDFVEIKKLNFLRNN